MVESRAELSKHLRMYLIVFGLLWVGTVATVLAARLDFRGHWNAFIAVAIAAVKASLVAAVFMHLKWERAAVIWLALVFCAVCLLALMILPVLTAQDLPASVQMGTWG